MLMSMILSNRPKVSIRRLQSEEPEPPFVAGDERGLVLAFWRRTGRRKISSEDR
jgi:hypothetical protein